MPCHRVKTTGRYAFGSWLNRIVDPASRCRSTLLSRWIAPVKNVPAGTITWPPPHRSQAAIAALNAAVQSVTPSPAAPNLVTGKYLLGNRGRRTDATIRSAAASAGSQVRPARPVKALPLAVAAGAARAGANRCRLTSSAGSGAHPALVGVGPGAPLSLVCDAHISYMTYETLQRAPENVNNRGTSTGKRLRGGTAALPSPRWAGSRRPGRVTHLAPGPIPLQARVAGEAAGGHASTAGDAGHRHVGAGRGDVGVKLADVRVLRARGRAVQVDVFQRQAQRVRRVEALEHGFGTRPRVDGLEAIHQDAGEVRRGRAVAAGVERGDVDQVLHAGLADVVVSDVVDLASVARVGFDPDPVITGALVA